MAAYDLDLFSNFTYALNDPVAGDGIVQRDDRLYTGGRIEYERILGLAIPARLRAGAEWRYDDARVRLGTQTRRRTTGFTNDDDVEELSIGPYVEAELLPLPWARFVGGLRFEYFDYDVRSRLPGEPEADGNDKLWLPKANLVLSPFSEVGPLPSETVWLRDLEAFLNFGIGFHSNDARTSVDDLCILARATGAEIGLRTRFFERLEVARPIRDRSSESGWRAVDVSVASVSIFQISYMNAPDLFGTFANPLRLRILNLLQAEKEICVCDLCEVLGVVQPKVSRHLAVLREAGLVEVRRDGKWKFYSLAEAPTPLHRTLLRCVRTCLVEVDELAADRERLAAIEPRLRCG